MEESVLHRKFVFEHAGKVWQLARPHRGTKAAYGQHIEQQVIQGIRRNRQNLDDNDYLAAMKVWTQGFAGGEYRWRGPLFYATLNDQDNQIKLAWLWIRQSDPNVPEKAVEEMWGADGGKDEAGNPTTQGERFFLLMLEMVTEKNLFPPPPQKEGATS